VERSDTHRVTMRRHDHYRRNLLAGAAFFFTVNPAQRLTRSKAMGFARAQPILRAIGVPAAESELTTAEQLTATEGACSPSGGAWEWPDLRDCGAFGF
jgi:hypothetical protein